VSEIDCIVNKNPEAIDTLKNVLSAALLPAKRELLDNLDRVHMQLLNWVILCGTTWLLLSPGITSPLPVSSIMQSNWM
jgi:hypothetical protein